MCLFLVAAWESLRPRRRREFPALRRRLGNIGFWVANLLLAGFLLGSPEETRIELEAAFGWRLPVWPIGSGWLSLVAGFLLLDLMRYAVHRCEHAVPLLWRFHALHHTDPDVDVTTSVRHHPLEYVLASLAFWIVAIVLDLPGAVLLAYGVVAIVSEALQHGNIRLPEWLERFLQPVLVTVDMHRIHHSISYDEQNANFGAVFSIWDRLFGTYVQLPREQLDRLSFGVAELPRADAIKPMAMLLTPWLLARSMRSAAAER